MSDLQARTQATAITQSVLVQAPAGSGKTTLLVERYIGLLAIVDAPESILAITFTKKAAAEMRGRILTYLDPNFNQWEAHQQSLKSKVESIQERIQNWSLLENPQRLQIKTIDGFCHALTRTMPVVGALGPVPQPAEQPQKLYRKAARLSLIDDPADPNYAQACQRVLTWCDHNQQQLEALMIRLLAKREQWLKLIMSGGHLDRDQQNEYLAYLVEHLLDNVRAAVARDFDCLSPALTDFYGALSEAGHCLKQAESSVSIVNLAGLSDLPLASAKDLETWQGLAEALTTQQGTWRKSVTVKQGCPPKTAHKDIINKALNDLQSHGQSASLLRSVARLPDPHYSDEDWTILEALITVLRRAASHLELIFAQTGQSDFTAIAAAALRGLGDAETGFSDLALYLDQRIEHILVDEYQDTNWTQFRLLEKLTQGWDSEPHRTLFLVGDPMQSIYRFREAEVGLFVQTRQTGIGGLTLKSVQLTENFRSCQTIVDWVNGHLGPLFPTEEDIASGAIAYAPSTTSRSTPGQVQINRFDDTQSEADAIADHLEVLFHENEHNKEFKAAIIVRARSHLQAIVPTLQRRGIKFRAVKLDRLIDQPVVQDLLALTQAIQNTQHKTAVLALLRSPMIGLTLKDLSLLTHESEKPLDRSSLQHLDADAAQRARRLWDVLEGTQALMGRRPLSTLVEGAWYQLGGASVDIEQRHQQQSREVEAYLNALSHAETQGLLTDWNDFIEWLEQNHTDGDIESSDVKLDVLTMHSAKGLEWDAVIIPSLHANPNRADGDLLHWLPFPMDGHQQGVLMAPMRGFHQTTDSPLVDLIKQEQKKRHEYEALRLMYVATTRAKSNLMLSAVISSSSQGEVKPIRGSLLDTIWPTLGAKMCADLATTEKSKVSEEASELTPSISVATVDQTLYRLPQDFEMDWPQPCQWVPDYDWPQKMGEVEFNWAGTQARRSGTVIHQLMERVARKGLEHHTQDDIARCLEKIPMLLRWAGTGGHQLNKERVIIEQTFQAVLSSETGRWLLSSTHEDSQCEYAISGMINNQLIHAIVDRTFIDKKGTRWIVDYKSGYHAGGDLATFLDQEAERYRDQLMTYKILFAQKEERPTTVALYLPRHDALKVVE